MNKKLDTIKLKGNDYATVPIRLKAFREENPRALVETKPHFREDGMVTFEARIIKDKADENSAESTGHSYGKLTGDKSFEKLETVATGRALALLGYLNSGEIATSEEMEEYYEYKQERHIEAVEQAIEAIEACKTIDELKTLYMSLETLIRTEERVMEAKDKRKEALNAKNSTTKAK